MATVSLSMIVRDAEATLPNCLTSVRGVVDEMVIADTGSTDRTCEIAAGHGARVISIPWEDDFASARNCALREATCDWVLVLDADEMLDASAAGELASAVERTSVAGYIVPIRNYIWTLSECLWDRPPEPNNSDFEAVRLYPAYVTHENVRLFRRHPSVQFIGQVHETVGHRILELGMKLACAEFVIHHLGMAVDPATRARKSEFYRRLGRHKLQDMPSDAQAHFELGVELAKTDEHQEALKCFERACELNARFSVAWLLAALSFAKLGNHHAALKRLQHVRGDAFRMSLVEETRGDAYYNLGQFDLARKSYRRAMEGTKAFIAVESKLGLAEVRSGRVDSGLSRLRHAIETAPGHPELHDRLIQAYVWLDRLDEAALASEHKLDKVQPQPEFFPRAASIWAKQGRWEPVVGVLRAGLERCPGAERIRETLAQAQQRTGTTVG